MPKDIAFGELAVMTVIHHATEVLNIRSLIRILKLNPIVKVQDQRTREPITRRIEDQKIRRPEDQKTRRQ